MKKNNYVIVFYCLTLLILSGCSSKFYFEPKEEEIAGKISYNNSLPAAIEFVTRDGATLKNGQFITKNGEIPSFKLPKDARFLNESEDFYLATNNNFEILIIHKDTQEIQTLRLDYNAVSVSLNQNLLAIITDANILFIYDWQSQTELFRHESNPAPANNTLIASPLFLSDIAILPTLDGKLVIVDKARMQIIRNIVVNGEKYFNNVIFLDAIGTRMVAATPKRVISVSPSIISTFDANIRDLLFFQDRIFLFTSEGEVILTDQDLNEIKREKFDFAHFSTASHGRKIAILETQGFMITLDEELGQKEILALPDEISVPTFSGTNKIFIDNKIIEIN